MDPEDDDATFRLDVALSYADLTRIVGGLSMYILALREDLRSMKAPFDYGMLMLDDERGLVSDLRYKLESKMGEFKGGDDAKVDG